MENLHLTTPLRRAPYSQYRVGSLEIDEVRVFAPELAEIEGASVESAADEPHEVSVERYEALVRRGGQITVAMRVPEVGSPIIDAVLIQDQDTRILEGRHDDTPKELLGYLASIADPNHQASGRVETLSRQRRLSEIG